MLVLKKSDELKVREVDKNIKNKFKFDWLDKKVTLKLKKGEVSVLLSDFILKVDVPGKAKCSLCNDVIDYGGRGWKSLESHLTSSRHKNLMEIRKENFDLGHNFLSDNASLPRMSSSTTAAVPLSSLILTSQATVLGFIAEHNLPFSLSPHLINLSKELARDQKALSSLSMDRTSASIKMRFGVAESLLAETIENIKSTPFSLNIDEATNNNSSRILSILVSYFSEAQQRVVIEHLSSIQLYSVTSASVYSALHSFMTDNNIPYENLMSLMMDSCAVMRGSKSGLETQIRSKNAPHLLDVDGDSCHHIHNATKKFCKEFGFHAERLFSDVNTDFKWSAQLKLKLEELCDILGVKYSPPERYLSHRWLSCYDVAIETLRMWDILTLFYYSYLKTDEKETYQSIIININRKRNLDEEKLMKVKILQEQVKKLKRATNDGKNRKEGIIKNLFCLRKKTLLHIQTYIAILPLLKNYVCLFQSTEPLIHKLYAEQKKVLKTFLSCFIKPEVLNTKSLMSDDLIIERNVLANKHLFIGFGADGTLSKCNKSVAGEFFSNLKKAYVSCGQYLRKKLPLENQFLRCANALNPSERGKTETLENFELLPTVVTNILSNEDLEKYLLDVRNYQIDNLAPYTESDEKVQRLDEWWASVFSTGNYPCLSKLVKAIISLFHGPVVENTFSSMNYILDSRSGRMDVKTYSAVQTVRTSLKAKNKSSLEYFHRNNVRFDPVNVNLIKNIQNSNKRYREEKKTKEAGENMTAKSEKKLTKTAGQVILKEFETVALKSHTNKRKEQENSEGALIPDVKKQKTTKNSEQIVLKVIPSMEKEQKLQGNGTNSEHLEKNSKHTSRENQKDLWKAFFQTRKEKK